MVLGDPVPWFTAPVITGGSFDLHVSAGRWVVLSFLGAPGNPQGLAEINALMRESAHFSEDQVIIGCVFTGQPDDLAAFAAVSSNKLFFLRDDGGAISRMFGAAEMPRTVVLDPMLRSIADIPWDTPQGHAETVRRVAQPSRRRQLRRRAVVCTRADGASRLQFRALRFPGAVLRAAGRRRFRLSI